MDSASNPGPFEILHTTQQAECDEWQPVHGTAFLPAIAIQRSRYNYLRKAHWGLDKIQTKTMNYGTESEPKAFEDYVRHNGEVDDRASVARLGFGITPSGPNLAAVRMALLTCLGTVVYWK